MTRVDYDSEFGPVPEASGPVDRDAVPEVEDSVLLTSKVSVSFLSEQNSPEEQLREQRSFLDQLT